MVTNEKYHGLNLEHLKIIRSILSPYANDIEKVCLFGSRATGKFKPQSDIDMVIFGRLNQEQQDRIWTLFDESLLPMTVDVNIYDLITYRPLKDHIDQCHMTLFTQDDLL